mmetsp:Transcript_66483/g.185318  ORF Transcript_66483/g.185318 Transcript_66483/m.185318 type:complete len:317 (-) Transcript_66483:66-1016(-)
MFADAEPWRRGALVAIIALAACAAPTAASSEPLALVQRKATMLALPKAAELFNSTEKAYDVVRSKVAEFSKTIEEEQKQVMVEIQREKGNYRKKLVELRERNRAVFQENEDISAHIEDLHHSVSALRDEARDVRKESQSLVAKFQAVGQNLTSAIDFDVKAMGAFKEQLDRDELMVLDDLDKKEQILREASERERRLSSIANVAMINVVGVGEEDLSAEDFLKDIAHRLSERRAGKDAGMQVLTEAYEEMETAATRHYQDLVERRGELKKQEDAAEALKKRVEDAVGLLREHHKELQHRFEALQAYVRKIADQAGK